MRGSGSDGLSAISPGPQHPILRLRRQETVALCAEVGISPVIDPTNADPSMWRNRVRHELLPLLNNIAERDVIPILSRTADVLRELGRSDAVIDDLYARQVAAQFVEE